LRWLSSSTGIYLTSSTFFTSLADQEFAAG
jgi:hypothetical protein